MAKRKANIAHGKGRLMACNRKLTWRGCFANLRMLCLDRHTYACRYGEKLILWSDVFEEGAKEVAVIRGLPGFVDGPIAAFMEDSKASVAVGNAFRGERGGMVFSVPIESGEENGIGGAVFGNLVNSQGGFAFGVLREVGEFDAGCGKELYKITF